MFLQFGACYRFSFEKMTHHTQLEDKLGWVDNFRAWKYKISLILEENDLDQFNSVEVPEPEGDEAKATHKRIIAYSINCHLIPLVSTFKTPKEVYDALTRYSKGRTSTGI